MIGDCSIRVTSLGIRRSVDLQPASCNRQQCMNSPASTSSAPAPEIRRHQRARPALPRSGRRRRLRPPRARRGCCAPPGRTRSGSTSARRRRSRWSRTPSRLLLAEKAREGKTVVRLKWGDPFVFDSGGKEALFLHEQGIPFEVVPGIPVTVGGPAYAGIPVDLSGRRRRRSTLVRGHESESGRPRGRWTGASWPASAARSSATRARGRSARSPGAPGERPPAGGDRRAHLRRDAPRRSGPSRARSGRSPRASTTAQPALLVVGAVVGLR